MQTLFLLIFGQILEAPEPTPPVYTYEFEIGWNTKTAIPYVWTPITPKSCVVSNGVAVNVHNYDGRIGDNRFQAVAMDSTPDNPRKVEVVINIASLPSNANTNYFRIRGRAKTTINGVEYVSEWSDPSFYVQITKLKKNQTLISVV